MKRANFITALIAMGSIAFLEVLALYKGIDGVALSVAIGALAGLGGYRAKSWQQSREK